MICKLYLAYPQAYFILLVSISLFSMRYDIRLCNAPKKITNPTLNWNLLLESSHDDDGPWWVRLMKRNEHYLIAREDALLCRYGCGLDGRTSSNEE